jgi:hypothetical protein
VGGLPGQGVVVDEGVKEVKEASMPQNIYKNITKKRWFRAFIDLKIAENAVFYSKALNKIYFQDVFEEYKNFKFFVTYT